MMKSKNKTNNEMGEATQFASNEVLAGKAKTPEGLPAHIYIKGKTASLYPATLVLEFPPFIKMESGIEDICISISEFLEIYLECYEHHPKISKAYKKALKKFYPDMGANELFDLAG